MNDTKRSNEAIANDLAEQYVKDRDFKPRPSLSGANAGDLITLLFAEGEARIAFKAGYAAALRERMKDEEKQAPITVTDAIRCGCGEIMPEREWRVGTHWPLGHGPKVCVPDLAPAIFWESTVTALNERGEE